jgi:uncharacterized membrane protein YhaH (DUF805 family)
VPWIRHSIGAARDAFCSHSGVELIERTFWVGLVVIVGVTALAILLNGKRVSGGALGDFFALVIVIAVLSPYCLTAVVVKRLHDLDRSGWHAFVLVVAFFLVGLAAWAYEGLRQDQITLEEWRKFWTTVFYVTAALAVALLALGFTRGRGCQPVWARPGCNSGAAASPRGRMIFRFAPLRIGDVVESHGTLSTQQAPRTSVALCALLRDTFVGTRNATRFCRRHRCRTNPPPH